MINKPSELSALDWIRYASPSLRVKSMCPEDRIHYTGHVVHLPRAYIPSIGNWCRADTRQLINIDCPNEGLVKVRHGAFRQFRHKNGLFTRREYELLYGRLADQPWHLAEHCWMAVAHAQGALLRVNGTTGSLGEAARKAVQDALARSRPLGVLPIEVVLWTRVFDTFLSTHLLSYDEWAGFSHEERVTFWAPGIAGKRWDIGLVVANPARGSLPFSEGLIANGCPPTRYAELPRALGPGAAGTSDAARPLPATLRRPAPQHDRPTRPLLRW